MDQDPFLPLIQSLQLQELGVLYNHFQLYQWVHLELPPQHHIPILQAEYHHHQESEDKHGGGNLFGSQFGKDIFPED